MLVVGATIGSGVLGLAYASRKAGWPVCWWPGSFPWPQTVAK